MGTRQIAGITEMMSRDPFLEGLYSLVCMCAVSFHSFSNIYGVPSMPLATFS